LDTLNAMRAFACVAESGSFTAAARQLQTTTAQVSRAVAKLETHLQARLLNRTTRRIALTEAGERYLARCARILADIAQAESEAGDAHAQPAGRLRIHSIPGIGQHYVIPAIAGYQRLYPEVRFELTLANHVPDLLDEGYDVAIVIAAELPDSGLVAQQIGEIYSILCASPAYIARRGMPQSLAELAGHDCLRLLGPPRPLEKWTLDGPRGRETATLGPPPFQVNVGDALVKAVGAGMGIGTLPVYSAHASLQDGTLLRVLPEYRLQGLNVYALYPSRQYLDAKIRTWIAYLRQALPGIL